MVEIPYPKKEKRKKKRCLTKSHFILGFVGFISKYSIKLFSNLNCIAGMEVDNKFLFPWNFFNQFWDSPFDDVSITPWRLSI